MEKIFIKQAIIVEGKYDKIKLESIFDALILTSNGFRIFKDKEKVALIKEIAKKDGIIILTDSDVAGFKLRNYIRSCTKDAKVINIYIPQVEGKEKRKTIPSKEGFLGVEGIDSKKIKQLFFDALVIGEEKPNKENQITKMNFYEDGLIGKQNSSFKRQALLKKLNLPTYLTTNSLLEIINRLISRDEYVSLIEQINNNI